MNPWNLVFFFGAVIVVLAGVVIGYVAQDKKRKKKDEERKKTERTEVWRATFFSDISQELASKGIFFSMDRTRDPTGALDFLGFARLADIPVVLEILPQRTSDASAGLSYYAKTLKLHQKVSKDSREQAALEALHKLIVTRMTQKSPAVPLETSDVLSDGRFNFTGAPGQAHGAEFAKTLFEYRELWSALASFREEFVQKHLTLQDGRAIVWEAMRKSSEPSQTSEPAA